MNCLVRAKRRLQAFFTISPVGFLIGLPIFVAALGTSTADAAGGATIVRAVTSYFGKESAGEAAEWVTKKGGREMAEKLSQKAASEGGEATVERVAGLAGKYGPDAVRGLDNVATLRPVLGAIDELPASQIGPALSRLAAGVPGKELGEAVTRFGSGALRAELKHPGVGVRFANSLGDDGIVLAQKLTTDQAIAIGRHVDDIAKLPAVQRGAVLEMMSTQTDRFVSFIGSFVKANPGVTLFTAASTGIILANKDAILGGDEIVFDADGNPTIVSKSGLLERASSRLTTEVGERFVSPTLRVALALAATIIAIYSGIKLHGMWKRQQA